MYDYGRSGNQKHYGQVEFEKIIEKNEHLRLKLFFAIFSYIRRPLRHTMHLKLTFQLSYFTAGKIG